MTIDISCSSWKRGRGTESDHAKGTDIFFDVDFENGSRAWISLGGSASNLLLKYIKVDSILQYFILLVFMFSQYGPLSILLISF